jgi:Circularly permutated YpsA SLOG family
MRSYAIQKVISGGQTGVDQAALEAALRCGIPIDGWCPRHRHAEDGEIPKKFLLRETASDDVAVRTELNVINSDSTLLLTSKVAPEDGTQFTETCAKHHRKPYVKIFLDEREPTPPAVVRTWLEDNRTQILNVAGPRASQRAGIYNKALEYLVALFTTMPRPTASLVSEEQLLFFDVSEWLARAGRVASPNSVALLRELVMAGESGLTAGEIETRLLKTDKPDWAKRNVWRLKAELEDFRTGAGASRKLCYRFREPAGDRYILICEPNIPKPGPEAIWLPHFWWKSRTVEGEKVNVLVITEPVMFRDLNDGYYIRDFTVNEPDPEMLARHLPTLNLRASTLKATSHYVSLGEVRAMWRVEHALREIRSDSRVLVTTNQEKRSWSELPEGNVILTGTSRANGLISKLQETEPTLRYTLGAMNVSMRDITPHEQAVLNAKTQGDYDVPDLPGKTYYGVFTRITESSGRTITAIACNHGPATNAIAEYLCSTRVAHDMIPHITTGDWKGLPDSYQLLFRVSLDRDSERHGEAEFLCHCIL